MDEHLTLEHMEHLQHVFRAGLDPGQLRALVRQLGVSSTSLTALGVGWSERDGAYTFPERSFDRAIVGILRRYPDGRKFMVRGSRRGLYIPENWAPSDETVYVPEGVTDTAALLDQGASAVGRPSCNGGSDALAGLLRDQWGDVIVVGENDQKPDGRWPGRDGARLVAGRLASAITATVRVSMPPNDFKDVREFLTREVHRDQ